MSQKKENQSALELWEQVFKTLANQPDAALVDPDYDQTEDEKRSRQGFKEAGWSDEFIDRVTDLNNKRVATALVSSPGVNPHVEFLFEQLRADIETAMERLKLTSHNRVAWGIEPKVGPHAAKIGVVMTEESIVTVGSHLFRFCGLIARATTRTLNLDPFIWDSPNWDQQYSRKLLLSAPDLLKYWMHIYLSYAVTGTNCCVPFKPAKRHELVLFEQIARAMEVFAIAHEYGHHHYGHGRSVGEKSHQEEFEADQFALKVCYEVERFPIIIQNPYLSSGAGGAALLLALEQLRSVVSMIAGKKTRVSDSHPTALARIKRMDSVAIMKPTEFKSLHNFRIAVIHIMSSVNSILSETLPEVRPTDFLDLRRTVFATQ